MASTGEAAAERSLLDAAPPSYGTAPAAERPQLTPDQLLKELTRNADVYKDMLFNYLLKGLAPLLTEALGVFALVFVVGCAVTSPTPAPWAPVAYSATLAVMVYATWEASGAHLNPGVTFALALLGKTSYRKMMSYWLFQLLGAFAAAATYKMVCAPHLAVVAPVPPFTPAYALIAEAMFTTVLVFVVLSVCLKPSGPNAFYGLAIGFALLGSAYACGHISGAALNPGIALALGVSAGQGYHWAFAWCAAELAGSAAAAGLWRLLRGSQARGDTGAAGAVEPGAWRRCAAEGLGTFVLVAAVGLNIVSASHATAYSAAALLMAMIQALGDLSGHFNPAVTLAVLLRKKIEKKEALKYLLAQVVAALLAAGVYVAFHMGSKVVEKSIKLTPGQGYSLFQAGLAELVSTSLLCYAVLAVASHPAAGLVISSALMAGAFAVAAVSGGELNPALTLALALGNLVHPGKGGTGPASSWLTLIACELLGACVAAGLYGVTHRRESLAKEEAKEDVEAQS